MSISLPQLRVGEPQRHRALSVFPIFCPSPAPVDYRLSVDALADESLVVEEVDSSGSVPELVVDNHGDARVLFLEGEELVGAKQNRILNTSVLIAAHSKVKIPVSCVERGRWRFKSKAFRSSGSQSPSKLRRMLRRSVSDSVKHRNSHRSDQGAIWEGVDELQCAYGGSTPTAAMSDTFEKHEQEIKDYREDLKYVSGATGMAVAVGKQVLSVDVFDKPQTCQQVWTRLLSGVIFDAMARQDAEECACIADVQHFIATTEDLSWAAAPAVGEGEEYRAESQQGNLASALTFGDTVLHGSVLAGSDA